MQDGEETRLIGVWSSKGRRKISRGSKNNKHKEPNFKENRCFPQDNAEGERKGGGAFLGYTQLPKKERGGLGEGALSLWEIQNKEERRLRKESESIRGIYEPHEAVLEKGSCGEDQRDSAIIVGLSSQKKRKGAGSQRGKVTATKSYCRNVISVPKQAGENCLK